MDREFYDGLSDDDVADMQLRFNGIIDEASQTNKIHPGLVLLGVLVFLLASWAVIGLMAWALWKVIS